MPTPVKLELITLLASVVPVIDDAAVVPVGITTDPPSGIRLPLILIPPAALIVNVFVTELVTNVTFDPAATFNVSDKDVADNLACPVIAKFENPGVAGNVLTILAYPVGDRLTAIPDPPTTPLKDACVNAVYNSVKLALTLVKATRNVSPVPLLAVPMFNICCDIFYPWSIVILVLSSVIAALSILTI